MICSGPFWSVRFCSVLFCSVLFCSVLFQSVLFCHNTLRYIILCDVMLCYVIIMLFYVMLCHAMLCYVMLRYIMLCSATLWYVMAYSDKNKFPYTILGKSICCFGPLYQPCPRSSRQRPAERAICFWFSVGLTLGWAWALAKDVSAQGSLGAGGPAPKITEFAQGALRARRAPYGRCHRPNNIYGKHDLILSFHFSWFLISFEGGGRADAWSAIRPMPPPQQNILNMLAWFYFFILHDFWFLLWRVFGRTPGAPYGRCHRPDKDEHFEENHESGPPLKTTRTTSLDQLSRRREPRV